MRKALDELKGEVRKGATYCTRLALRAFAESDNPIETAEELLKAKPMMAPIVNIALEAKAHFEKGGTAAGWAKRLEEIELELEEKPRRIAEWMASHESGHRVMTCSYSDMVYGAAIEVEKTRTFHLSITEGRPLNEGALLAKRLAYAGVPVTLGVDGAALLLLEECDAVWVGADAVGHDYFVNKIGTRALLLGAKVLQKPIYVLAGPLKQWPEGREWHQENRPPEEVYSGAEPPLQVINRYFEKIPLDWASHILL
ncbi:MAG: hypothetical protein AB7F31_02470 [Parachlamydiales bacterium]